MVRDHAVKPAKGTNFRINKKKILRALIWTPKIQCQSNFTQTKTLPRLGIEYSPSNTPSPESSMEQTSQVALSSSSFPRMRKREGSKVARKACSKGENDNWGKTWWKQYEWCFGHLLASTIPHLFQSVYMSVLYCWGEWSEDIPCWPTLFTFGCVWMLIHKWFYK